MSETITNSWKTQKTFNKHTPTFFYETSWSQLHVGIGLIDDHIRRKIKSSKTRGYMLPTIEMNARDNPHLTGWWLPLCGFETEWYFQLLAWLRFEVLAWWTLGRSTPNLQVHSQNKFELYFYRKTHATSLTFCVHFREKCKKKSIRWTRWSFTTLTKILNKLSGIGDDDFNSLPSVDRHNYRNSILIQISIQISSCRQIWSSLTSTLSC